jgi:hypothetical protein
MNVQRTATAGRRKAAAFAVAGPTQLWPSTSQAYPQIGFKTLGRILDSRGAGKERCATANAVERRGSHRRGEAAFSAFEKPRRRGDGHATRI